MEQSKTAEKPQAQVNKQDLYVSKDEFMQYRRVQEQGRFNMLDPNARYLTELSSQQWLHIIKNYSYFIELYGSEIAEN